MIVYDNESDKINIISHIIIIIILDYYEGRELREEGRSIGKQTKKLE